MKPDKIKEQQKDEFFDAIFENNKELVTAILDQNKININSKDRITGDTALGN